MPAYSDVFPWPSHYGKFNFFEERMREHSRVSEIVNVFPGVYEVTRSSGDVLRIFICECYSFGVAEYYEVEEKIGNINAIIINSSWCGYTDDVKMYCMGVRVGVFTIRGFMAALNKEKYWEYLDKNEADRFRKRGWFLV